MKLRKSTGFSSVDKDVRKSHRETQDVKGKTEKNSFKRLS